MSHELDVHRIAAFMVQQFGEKAPDRAAARAAKYLARGDLAEGRVWLRVLHAMGDVAEEEPREQLH